MKKKIFIASLNEVPYIPLIYGYLRVYCELDEVLKNTYSFEEPFYYKTSVQEVLSRIENPSVLGLSCYVWNFRRNMKIAKLTKQKYPECLVVVGGAHIPKKDKNFFKEHPYIDVAIHGEGEYAFRELLRQYLKPEPNWNKVPGISYNFNGESVNTGDTVKLPKEILLPSPYLEGHFDTVIKECHERNLMFTAPWETNRGCPYGCTFCDWGMLTLNKIRTFHEQRLLDEIQFFRDKKVPIIFICDANFGILKRDLHIAEKLTEAKLSKGYPMQIKVNFAKNTNEAVFNISSSWNEADLLMGTTISLQSNDDTVLEAIKRKNIKKSNFYKLQNQYKKSGIDTYTELILGLPKESVNSFKNGINQILLSNSHDDLRVYELNLLPNAPMNEPDYIAEHGIKTTKKYLFSKRDGQAEDEIEIVDLVIATNTMDTRGWIECNVFSQLIQSLHNGCYTKYISIFLYRTIGMDYRTFYDGLVAYFINKKDTVTGTLFNDLYELYESYLEHPEIPMSTLIFNRKKLLNRISSYGKRRGWTVANYCWLYIADRLDEFYGEITDYIFSITPVRVNTNLLYALISYQKERMLQVDYNPEKGKRVAYPYNFISYFESEYDPESGPFFPSSQEIEIFYKDRYMGINDLYPIVKGDKARFAKASIGMSFPTVRVRHYQHQLDKAAISFKNTVRYENVK
jgi:putative methyltransferase